MDPATIIAGLNAAKGLATATQAPPAGPSQSNPFFGSNLFNADSSGWLVNFGTGQEQTNTGTRTAPTLSGNAPGAASLPGVSVGVSAAIPFEMLLIAGGALLVLVLLMKKRG